jgi:hypothetical protein
LNIRIRKPDETIYHSRIIIKKTQQPNIKRQTRENLLVNKILRVIWNQWNLFVLLPFPPQKQEKLKREPQLTSSYSF